MSPVTLFLPTLPSSDLRTCPLYIPFIFPHNCSLTPYQNITALGKYIIQRKAIISHPRKILYQFARLAVFSEVFDLRHQLSTYWISFAISLKRSKNTYQVHVNDLSPLRSHVIRNRNSRKTQRILNKVRKVLCHRRFFPWLRPVLPHFMKIKISRTHAIGTVMS